MSLVIPDEILHAAQMTEAELRQEIAVLLFEKDKLTLAQAARLADMSRLQFQHLISSRGIAIHYDSEDLEQDLKTLRELGRI
jgi:predicted HTH domain antitoxin